MRSSGRKINFRRRSTTTVNRNVSMGAGESLDLKRDTERALT